MVRVNTNLLLGGHSDQTGSIVIPSSPQLPSFQRQRLETPDLDLSDVDHAKVDAGATANRTKDPVGGGDFILVPSTPETSPLRTLQNRSQRAPDKGRGSPLDEDGAPQKQPILSDDDWTFPGIAEQPGVRHANETNAADENEYTVVDPEPAMRRRRDWTPPPADTIILNSDTSTAAAETWSSPRDSSAKKKQQHQVFTNLRDSFSCKDDDASTASFTTCHAVEKEDSFLTRRAIEMVPMGGDGGDGGDGGGSGPSHVKTKAPKRKARTITELAVAAYATPTSEDGSAPEPVPAKKGRITAGRAKKAAINPGLPLTKARKGINARPKEKVKKGKTGKNTPQACQAVLLSPQSAMAESSAQDFVFGTSSQLAGDESPTFLRALHTALRSSNQHDRQDADFFIEVDSVDLSSRTTTAIAAATTTTTTARPRLWAVGARIDGKLSFDNVVDLEDDISFPDDPEAIVLAQQAAEARMQKEAETETSIPEKPYKPSEPSEPSEPLKLQPDRANKKITAVAPPVAESKRPATAKATQPTDKLPSQEQRTAPAEAARPDFDLLTTAQLAAQVASFGYKPIRERTAMVSLLSQCWEAKNQPDSRAFHTSALGMPVSDTKAKKKKAAATVASLNDARQGTTVIPLPGNTGVAEQAGTHRPAQRPATEPLVFEIEDSESDGRLSPMPDLPSSPVSGDDLGLSMESESIDDGDMSLAAAPTGPETELFELITKAVSATPRTDDPANPSWHEKILMYDTIILETFTAWLNDGGQLPRMGYTGTVNAFEVKNWCESKSVCCTWKRNLHGKERKL